jgi:hypothetical protein
VPLWSSQSNSISSPAGGSPSEPNWSSLCCRVTITRPLNHTLAPAALAGVHKLHAGIRPATAGQGGRPSRARRRFVSRCEMRVRDKAGSNVARMQTLRMAHEGQEPELAGLPLHRWRVRDVELEPITRSVGDITRAELLGDDPPSEQPSDARPFNMDAASLIACRRRCQAAGRRGGFCFVARFAVLVSRRAAGLIGASPRPRSSPQC